MELQDWYKEAGISEKVYDFCSKIEAGLKERFEAIDRTAEYNQMKVLRAMQKHKVSAGCFESSTGYGYDDLGRRWRMFMPVYSRRNQPWSDHSLPVEPMPLLWHFLLICGRGMSSFLR